MEFDPKLAWDSLPAMIGGLGVTVSVVVLVLFFGMLVAIPMALARLSKRRWIAWPAAAYVIFFRGAPSLILLYFVYFGLGQLPIVRDGPFWFLFSSAFACAVMGFTLNHSSYVTEGLRGGLLAVPPGLIEAASALGISPRQVFWRIRLPLAFRYGFKAYQNEVLLFTKSTAVISAITLVDLTAVANEIFFATYDPFTPLLTAAAFYWLLVNVMRLGFQALDRRLNRHLTIASAMPPVPVHARLLGLGLRPAAVTPQSGSPS
ncbi:ABC transporter permease [Zavarzinia sp. CC-PAN008]|uniref:ABC transporter permease n=1 Tax=Zavarzinia sp. CC-PAN008 TaxID=3243332 RepID=UPI003F742392